MIQESLNNKPPIHKNRKAPDASLVIFDLPILIERLKLKHARKDGDLNSMILLKSPYKQIVLTTLHEGTEIKSFQSNDSITFQIIEGKVMFHTRKESAILDKGQLLTLHENINYRMTTKEETVLLLTIANGS
jgi:quercetin dioxygenase-like cupin family protein